MPQFQITKQFVSGPLAGLTSTEITSVLLLVGFSYKNYVVVAATEIEDNA